MILNVLYILLLGFVAFEDIKKRQIHIGSVIGLLVLGYFFNQNLVLGHWFLNSGTNLLFFTIQILCLWLYIQLRYKEGRLFFQKWLGMGDVLFLIGLSSMYSFDEMVKIYFGMLIFSLLMGLIFHVKQKTTIPLAGYFSIFLICYQLVYVIK